MRARVAGRLGQAISKLFFCLRVAGDIKTFFRLLVQSKMLARHSDAAGAMGGPYDEQARALAYRIRYLSRERTIYLRTYAGDILMFYELFWERAYWLPPAVAAKPLVPLVIVDAGANIGMAALYFSIVYPRARIYCIEPDIANFKLLQKNVSPEQGRIILLEAALYDRDGEIGLVKEQWAYNSKIDEDGDHGGRGDRAGGSDRGDRLADRRVVVPAVTMDTILDRFQLDRIDLLKIDIEGAEDKLFGGPTAWLEKVNTILIEVHRVEAIGPIRKRLEGNGFRWELWEGRKAWDRSMKGGKLQDATGGGGKRGNRVGDNSCSLYLASRIGIPGLANS